MSRERLARAETIEAIPEDDRASEEKGDEAAIFD